MQAAAAPARPATAPTTGALAGTAVAQPAAATIDPALGARWNTCVKSLSELGAVAAMVRELAQQAGLLHIDDSTTPPRWQLLVAREPLRNPALADKLAAALGASLGHPVVLEVLPGMPDDTPALRDAAERQQRQAAAEASIQQDPVVRELLQQFKTARIVPGSIKPV